MASRRPALKSVHGVGRAGRSEWKKKMDPGFEIQDTGFGMRDTRYGMRVPGCGMTENSGE
jgi:peroxiredoxin